MNYTIKRNFWGGKIDLFREGNVIGGIESRGFWRNTTAGYLHDKKFTFVNKGVFSSRTEIFDQSNNLIGDIEYSSWSSKAEVDLNGSKFYWKSSNFWATKWILEDQYNKEIHLVKSEFSVNYSTYEDNEFLFLLATFLLFNYHQKMSASGAA